MVKYTATTMIFLFTVASVRAHSFVEHLPKEAGRRVFRTESEIYKAIKSNPIKGAPTCLAVPWEGLLMQTYGRETLKKSISPPRANIKGAFTVCGHGFYPKIIPILKKWGVKYLFVPQAEEIEYHDSLTVVPIMHLASRICKPAVQKDILYSFVGFGSHPLRKKIFELPRKQDCIIIKRNCFLSRPQSNSKLKAMQQEYENVMARSRFALCPRGYHSSTVRLLEAIDAGAIPVSISDNLYLPPGVPWNDCIVYIKEEDIEHIDDIIRAIPPEVEEQKRHACFAISEMIKEDPAIFIRYYFALYPNNSHELQTSSKGSDLEEEDASSSKHIEDEAPIPVYLQNEKEKAGYNNCNMLRNGESFVVQRFAPSVHTIFDVGAGNGDWSALVRKYNPHATIYGFEPIKPTYDNYMKRFDPEKTHAFHVAVGDENKMTEIVHYSRQGNTNLSGLSSRPVVEKMKHVRKHIETIPMRTMQSVCEEYNIKHIDLLKIDTEGAEPLVLRGAQHLIDAQAIDIIQFEYGGACKDMRTTLKETYTMLTEAGYTIFRIIPQGLIHIEEWSDALENFQYCNYLALSTKYAQDFIGLC